MNLRNWKVWATIVGFALVAAVGTTGFVAAQQDGDGDAIQPITAVVQEAAYHRGGGQGDKLEALAEALGVTTEELQTAAEAASVAMIEQAAADGWITTDEADALIESGSRFRLGRTQYYRGIYDKNDFLADALGISVDALDDARTALAAERLAEMVEAGNLTEEEAEALTAVHAFRDAIDPDAIFAEALGISVSELDAARDATTSYETLLEELGLTADEVETNARAIMEAMINEAVEDGTLTQEQADRLLNGRHGRGGHGHGSRSGKGHHGGFGPRGNFDQGSGFDTRNGNGNAITSDQNA